MSLIVLHVVVEPSFGYLFLLNIKDEIGLKFTNYLKSAYTGNIKFINQYTLVF
jgi:hypothetical protein